VAKLRRSGHFLQCCRSEDARGKANPRNTTAPGPNDSGSDSASIGSSNRFIGRPCLLSVMKNNPQRMTMAAAYPTDAVAKIDAVDAARALDRTMSNGEDHRVPLT
jgi:hypothetical protein